MVRLLSIMALVAAMPPLAGCKRSSRGDPASSSPPPVPAGFVEHAGAGWRLALPATWKNAAHEHAVWAAADPQTAGDFRANVNVETEPFAGDSRAFARSNEAALRRKPGTEVDAVREAVVDGDATLLVEATWEPAPPSAVTYRTLQSMLASRGAGYVVTCAAAASAFERYRATCEEIARSFAVER